MGEGRDSDPPPQAEEPAETPVEDFMDAHGNPRLMDLEERADLAFGREDTIYRGGEHRAD